MVGYDLRRLLFDLDDDDLVPYFDDHDYDDIDDLLVKTAHYCRNESVSFEYYKRFAPNMYR